mmetsp:Transcript_33131/g.40654  ORF Transcript_33131/g.40654 Transcript_33131/m.40654 type:complete len:143 (-) Transcript_33131:102-530(-)
MREISSPPRREAIASLLVTEHNFHHGQISGFRERKITTRRTSINTRECTNSVIETPSFVNKITEKMNSICRQYDPDDLWVEGRIIIESKRKITNKKRTRSYFVSKYTGKKVWDRPPSGANRVVYLRDVKRVHYLDKNMNSQQ